MVYERVGGRVGHIAAGAGMKVFMHHSGVHEPLDAAFVSSRRSREQLFRSRSIYTRLTSMMVDAPFTQDSDYQRSYSGH